MASARRVLTAVDLERGGIADSAAELAIGFHPPAAPALLGAGTHLSQLFAVLYRSTQPADASAQDFARYLNPAFPEAREFHVCYFTETKGGLI